MEKDGITVIEIWSSSDEEEEGEEEKRTRSSSVFYFPKGTSLSTIKDEFKKKKKKTTIEFDEDCFILEDDPFDSLKKLSINDKENEDADDLSVIAERGQVACRDFPHSRHLCVKFPFGETPHTSHCEQCYCYVCDSIAPCKFWSDGPQEHCHATADEPAWKVLRKARRPISSTQGNLLDQRGMHIATAERHGSYQSISVIQPIMRDSFDYDDWRDYLSSQHMRSIGERADCGRLDHWPQECPSAAAGGGFSSVSRFNGGRAGNCNEERYINDRYRNHPYAGHRSPPAGGQYGGGYTYGNHDHRYEGDRNPQPARVQYGGGYNTYGNHDDRYAGNRSPQLAKGGQYGGGYTYGNHDDRYAGGRSPQPARGQYGGGYTYGNHDDRYAGGRSPQPARGQYGGGYRYSSPARGRFEGGDWYDGGAWDRYHHNGYGNERGSYYDRERWQISRTGNGYRSGGHNPSPSNDEYY